MLVDSIALNNNLNFRENARLKCLMTNLRNGLDDYLLIKPTTFMNLSGEAVRAVMDYYKIPKDDVLIVYDDLSLEIGKLRFRAGGSDGGHNGIKSVIQHLGTQSIARLKIGIGPQPNIPSEVFVLQNFTNNELDILKDSIIKAKEGIECYFKEGIAVAQNKFN